MKKRGKLCKTGRKKFLCLLLTISMVFALSGCRNGGGSGTDISGEGNADGTAGENTSSNTAMGRYVEEEIDLSALLNSPEGIYKREDGSLVILDSANGILVSRDRGQSWTAEMPDWFMEVYETYGYIMDFDMTPDGIFAILYDSTGDEYTPTMELRLPDGTPVPVEIPLASEEDYVWQIEISDDGRIFALMHEESVYEVYKDGSSKLIKAFNEYIEGFYVKGNLIFMDMTYLSGMPAIYDMESESYIEDEILAEFVADNYKERAYYRTNEKDMCLLPDENEVVYLIGNKGIHRHVVEGNMIEQIVDGSLTMLNNPAYTVISAVMPEPDTFLVLFGCNKLIRYTYDPDVPAVPDKVLSLYSLHEDETIRQIISYYQSSHPDVFVSYEVGMEEENALTREDAIKKLNTKIMAGTGPDLLIMEDMPLSSYIEKGMLVDITDYLAECSSEDPLFDNIIDALKVNEKAYIVPATFNVPILIGEEKYISNMTDMSDIAESVEALRTAHPGDDIIGICDAEDVLERFASVSAPVWLEADGSLNREAIEGFLEQGKRIYDAQMDGIRQAIVSEYYNQQTYWGPHSKNGWNVNWDIGRSIMGYISDKSYLLSGWLDTAYAYGEVISVERTPGYENSGVTAMAGDCNRVFMPQTLLGISAVSGQPDLAKDFMKFFLSAEIAANYYDFPINKAAYDKQFTPNMELGEDNWYGTIGIGGGDSEPVMFEVYWPSDEQIAELKEELASLTTAYIPDSVLEEAILDAGAYYVRGEQTLEEIVNDIEQGVAIYMSE